MQKTDAPKKGRQRRRTVLAALAASAMFVGVAAPVVDAGGVKKNGYKYCTLLPYARSYSTGYTEVLPPGSGYLAFNAGANWTVRQTSASSNGGGFWQVETNGALWSPGTYAGCHPYG